MNILKDNKGSVTVELSLFIALICGIIFGYMSIMGGIRTSIVLQVAAREGARAYATTDSASAGQIKANLELATMGVTGTVPVASVEGTGRSITITKVHNYTIPLFGTYTSTLRGYCTFAVEPVMPEGS